MANIINVQKMIEDNQFAFEKRQTQSPSVRFQETTPVFVTYYHINNEDTTTDAGFIDIASVLGARSPIRFDRIKNLPLYEMEQIVLQLEDTDQGLDSEFSGSATMLPGTIHPLQNDFFVIPTLHDSYVFRVTSIQYDNVTPDNYYKLEFQLEVIEDEYVQYLEDQTPDANKKVCIFNNIGSDNAAIIREDSFIKIKELEDMMSDMVTSYISMFYNERYNCLLGTLSEFLMQYIYDPYQAMFINEHNLFKSSKGMIEYVFEDQISDPRKKLKYEKSIYRFMENPDVNRLEVFPFAHAPGITYPSSVFHRWSDRHVQIVDYPKVLPVNQLHMFTREFVEGVKLNADMNSEYANLLKRYIRKEDLKLTDISNKLSEELVYHNDSLEVFFMTPLILYIIQYVIDKETEVIYKF